MADDSMVPRYRRRRPTQPRFFASIAFIHSAYRAERVVKHRRRCHQQRLLGRRPQQSLNASSIPERHGGCLRLLTTLAR